MTNKGFLIIDRSILPPCYEQVIKAVKLVENEGKSVSNVCKELDISRSTYYKYKDRNGGTSKTLASNVVNSILEKFNLPNRGLKTRLSSDGVSDYYHMIRVVNAPSIIIESSFSVILNCEL